MAWSASKIFSQYITDILMNTTAMDIGASGDTCKVALFDNSITPDQTVTSANSAYGAGQWASGGVSDAAGWPAAGNDLTTPTVTKASNVVTFDGVDTPSADSHTTLAGVYGCLVYDDTVAAPVADQGVCYNYFGGSNSVTEGTFTVVWNASGIFAL